MIKAIYDSLLQLLIVTPLFFLARRSNKNGSLVPVYYFVIVYFVSNILVSSLMDVTLSEGQQFNWVGKGAALLFLSTVVFSIPDFSSKQFGVTLKIRWDDAKVILALCIVYFIARAGLYFFSGEASSVIHPEAVLYQATLPGMQEELLYRGILLGLLNKIFQQPVWKFARVNFGWAVIITSVLFGLSHGVSFSENFNLSINYFSFFRTTFDGFLFALLVQKTKSIFPAVVYHNLLNLLGNH